ncbi:hypothetical protein AKJ66_02750 [candidate division MSBL1 archaeon SCGC-AAA259E22]|uniref:DUF2283 domain-containing protein n=2 Tax=candidate division MSBL1 TaxID=215777 RepID=A0A133U3M2_9EURY|nr:hypothetical protein AKJ61_04195 [candidate division MSBL1 archaeon SCGC-AAA259B11]KXA93092.1 hypothetical protein AKJ66_02750 [candidate division MSBL1 archaeon SCGC-AAA259E22]
MKYDYDPETDILTITISDEKPDYGEQAGSIINHYSKDGTPVEIEILDASETALSIIEPILSKGKKRAKA